MGSSSRNLTDGAAAVGKTRVMPDLLVVTGPPGAGKSTVASMLAERVVPSVVVRGDDFFAHLHEGATLPDETRTGPFYNSAADS